MSGPHEYSDRTIKKLYALSGNRCGNPSCNRVLVFSESGSLAHIGKICHIKGAKPGSLRYDNIMTDDERRSFENLIILCGACHDTVDDPEVGKFYSVEKLQAWKSASIAKDWMPGEHFNEWGEIHIPINEYIYKIPYYKIGNDIRYFSQEQYDSIEKAIFINIELAKISSFINMIQSYSECNTPVPNKILDEFNDCRIIPTRFHADWFDPKNSTFIQRFCMLANNNCLSLNELCWLNTAGNEPKKIIVVNKG